jgi:hypothetical protein
MLITATALCFVTLTRTYVFGIILAIAIILYARTRYAWAGLLSLCLLGFMMFPHVLVSTLESLRIVIDMPAEDFTTGRLDLNRFLVEQFSESPVFGVGAQEMRVRIALANTKGTTEHGYVSHFAAYGIFALLFLWYMFNGLFVAIRIIINVKRKREADRERADIQRVAIASLAIFTVLSGFVGLLGASSSFGDWLGIIFVSFSAAIGRKILTPAKDIAIDAVA